MRKEHDILSASYREVNERLKKYCEEIEPGTLTEYKNFFRGEADPYNMKSPKDATNKYIKLVHDFLTDKKY